MLTEKNYLFLNVTSLMFYRFLLMGSQESFAKYYLIGYVLAQLPTGYILDTVNPYNYVAFTSISLFILLQILNPTIEGNMQSHILLVIIGFLSAASIQSCIRFYMEGERTKFIIPKIIGQIVVTLLFAFIGFRPDYTQFMYSYCKIIYLFLAFIFLINRKKYVPIKENQAESLIGGFTYVIFKKDLLLLFLFTYFACLACYGYLNPFVVNHFIQYQGISGHFASQAVTFGFLFSYLIPYFIGKYTRICNFTLGLFFQIFTALCLSGLFFGFLSQKMNHLLLYFFIGGIAFAETASSVLIFNQVPTLTKKYITLSIGMMNLATMVGGTTLPVFVHWFSDFNGLSRLNSFFVIICVLKITAMLIYIFFDYILGKNKES